MVVNHDWPASPLAAAGKAFELLVAPPAPLAFDARGIDGMPDRHLPLDELRAWLLDRATGHDVRDAVWRRLVEAARCWGPQWMVGAVGVALPGLVRIAGDLARGYVGDSEDLDAEVLAGFLAAVRSVDLDVPRFYGRLFWAARRAGTKARWAEIAAQADRLSGVPASRTPARPYGHPDLVLGRAVAAGVITAWQAEVIGATRLEGMPVEQVAAAQGVTPSVLRMRRRRAELALASYLGSGDIRDHVTVDRPGSAGSAVVRWVSEPARVRAG